MIIFYMKSKQTINKKSEIEEIKLNKNIKENEKKSNKIQEIEWKEFIDLIISVHGG